MALVLTEADVKRLLSMGDLIESMETALAQFSTGGVVQPLRTVLQIGDQRAFFGVMPAYLSNPPALGTKLVTVYHTNAARGLPSHLATIVLLDPETGQLLALLDGRFITEARTAAVSAVSARHLANGAEQDLAILGSGVQARSHVEALCHACHVRQIRVWSPSAAHRQQFAEEMSHTMNRRVDAVDNIRDAVTGAGLVVLVTASPTPVLSASMVRDGAHIMAVGACRPDQREMDSALVSRARVFVDSRTAALAEAGDLVLPIAEGVITPTHILAELGEVVAGQAPGRTTVADVTIFKSLGLAVEDVAAAHLAYRRASTLGMGQPLEL